MFLFFCTGVASASADDILRWDSPRIERRAFANTPLVLVEYHFQNILDAPVTILDIKPSCGCTAGELTQRTYAPGESGVLEVSFNPKNRLGRNYVSIDVKTDAAEQPIRLSLAVEVIEQMRFPRRLMLWKRQDEAISPKYLDIYFEETGNVLELKASSNNNAFDVSIEKIPDSLHWKLRVSPGETARK